MKIFFCISIGEDFDYEATLAEKDTNKRVVSIVAEQVNDSMAKIDGTKVSNINIYKSKTYNE